MKIAIGKTQSADVLIYEYGVRLDKECVDAVNAEMVKGRRLYNELIACIRGIVEEIRAFVMKEAGPHAASLQARIDTLTEAFKAAKAEDNEDSMSTIAQERRGLWQELGAILKEVRTAHKQHIQSAYLSRIGRNTECDTYKIRCNAVRDELGWATANATLEAACIAFKKTFVTGQMPRFSIGAEKVQDGLTLQFTAAGGIAVTDIFDQKNSEFSLKANGCGPKRYGEFKFRIGTAKTEKTATGTFQYHRPIPPGSMIGLARLIRRRIGKDYKWAIQLMVKPPEPVTIETGRRKTLCTVHFGYSADLSGRRVAGITHGPDPSMAEVIRLPVEVELGLDRAADVQSKRDAERDAVVPQLASINPDKLKDEWLKEELQALRKLPAQYVGLTRLHGFATKMRDTGYVIPWLETWRKEDKMNWQATSHLAHSARNRRKTFYRDLALSLAKQYHAIGIEPLDLADAAKKVDEKTGKKTEFAKAARKGRVVAAIYELESALRWACAKANTAVFDLNAKTASTCSMCGGATRSDEEDSQLLHCNGCGAQLDRKKNGAAVAWQTVSDNIEDLIVDYHNTASEESQKRQVTKVEKQAKIIAGRKARIAEKKASAAVVDEAF